VTFLALAGCAYGEHHDAASAGYGYSGAYDGGYGGHGGHHAVISGHHDGGHGHGHGHHAGYGPEVHYQPAVAKIAVPTVEKHIDYYVRTQITTL